MSAIIINDKNKYGYPFPEETPQFYRELFGYVIQRGNWGYSTKPGTDQNYGMWWQVENKVDISEYKFLSPFEHLCNAIKIQWDTEFELEVRGYKNTSALRILEKLCFENDVAIAGPASLSKSFPVAAFSLIDWQAAPHCTSTFLATTTLGASEDRIWGMTRKLLRASNFKIGHLVDYRNMIVFVQGDFDDSSDNTKDYSNAIKALAIPQGNDGVKAVETTRGRKNKRVRLFLDELAEMDKYALNARVNLQSNMDFMFVGVGNPLPNDNPHSELCMPDDERGFDAVNENMKEWKTRTGVCIFLNGDDSPNFQAPEDEPPPFPYLLTRAKQRKMLATCYGDESALDYVRNAKGFAWRLGEIAMNIISKAMIKREELREDVTWSPDGFDVICGFDTAFTLGGDRIAATFAKLGMDRRGVKRLQWIGTKVYFPKGEIFEDAVAKAIVEECIKVGVNPWHFGMDISADGGKISQAIMREWAKNDARALEIIPISSMGSPSDRIMSGADRRTSKDVYDRRVTEYWFDVNRGFLSGVLVGLDPDSPVATELCERRYGYKNKKLCAETKPDMKGRIGQSPDLADSYVYATVVARKYGLEFPEIEVKQSRPARSEPEPDLNMEEIEDSSYSEDDWGEED
jgi:hypothetical protein